MSRGRSRKSCLFQNLSFTKCHVMVVALLDKHLPQNLFKGLKRYV
jgi:hypothetical protein